MKTPSIFLYGMLTAIHFLLPGVALAVAPGDSESKFGQPSQANRLKPEPRPAGRVSRRPKDSIEVQVVGTLRAGVFAIGGETTGTTITAKGITWELDFGRKPRLREAAIRLDGKRVMVRGALDRRPGVEIQERWIVTVAEVRPADDLSRNSQQSPVNAAQSRATDGKNAVPIPPHR